MNVFAENSWVMKKFTPVTSTASSVHTTVAGDGSVYVSSSVDKDFNFANKVVTAATTSTCVVKYDKSGDEIWAISFNGKNDVRAMTVDTDGNLYVAGTVTGDQTEFIGTDGSSKTIVNPTRYDEMWGEEVVSGMAGYIIKIDSDGKILAAQQVNAAGPESGYWGEARVNPNKIVVDNGKVYVSCFYNGAVESLGWEGRYVTMLDFETFETSYFGDITGAGVFSLSRADLTQPTSIANVMATTDADMLDDGLQCGPEAFSFVTMSGMVGVAFIGWGNETLTVPGQTPKNFSFEVNGGGLNEHAMVLSMTSNIESMSLVYHAAPQDKEYTEYNLFGEMSGTNIILGGTFSGQFPLDNSKSSKSAGEENKYNHASFLASISPMTSSVNYSWVNEAEDESFTNGMVVTGEETHVGTDAKVYNFNTFDGTAKGSESMAILDAAQFNDQYVALVSTDGADVVTMFQEMSPSAVQSVKAAGAEGAKYFGIDGTEIPAPQKGISIVKTADGVKKIVK
jgi:hypothetical protein